METLVKDVFGLLITTPAQTRVFSLVCKKINDTIRGLFTLTKRIVKQCPIESCNVYKLTGKNYEAIINVSSYTRTIAVRSAADEDNELVVDVVSGRFYTSANAAIKPKKLVSVNIGGELFLAYRDDLPVIMDFSGILFSDAFNLRGYYDNYTGVDVDDCIDDDGVYYCDYDYQLVRVNVAPHLTSGGLFELERI